MKPYIDCHSGDHALICGNGVSIRQYEPDWYMEWKGPTFGVNRILYWFTPRYYFNVYGLDNRFCDTTINKLSDFEWASSPVSINLNKDGRMVNHGTVGLTALNAAYQMGCSRISLIGIDLKPDKRGRNYFWEMQDGLATEYLHGRPGVFTLAHFKDAIDMLGWRGVEVVNLSEDSLL